MHPKTLEPSFLPWESTISTYGLNKILQVSCIGAKAIKIAHRYVWPFIVREIKLCAILWWWRNKIEDCIIKVAITRGNITWRSFALRACASKNKKRMTTSASLCEGPIFYFYLLPLYKSHGDHHLSFLHFFLWQALCVGAIRIYIYPLGCRFS